MCISFYNFSVSFIDRTLFEFYKVFVTSGLGISVTGDKTETQSTEETCPKLHGDKTRLDLEFPIPMKVLSFYRPLQLSAGPHPRRSDGHPPTAFFVEDWNCVFRVLLLSS